MSACSGIGHASRSLPFSESIAHTLTLLPLMAYSICEFQCSTRMLCLSRKRRSPYSFSATSCSMLAPAHPHAVPCVWARRSDHEAHRKEKTATRNVKRERASKRQLCSIAELRLLYHLLHVTNRQRGVVAVCDEAVILSAVQMSAAEVLQGVAEQLLARDNGGCSGCLTCQSQPLRWR
jgi:hypothetical protein